VFRGCGFGLRLVGVAVVGVWLDGVDSAEMEWAEGAGAEGTEGVERGDDGVGILEQQAAGGGEREDGAEGAVEGFDLYLAIAGEGCGALEGEGEALREREVVGVGQRDGLAGSGLNAFAQDGENGARQRNYDR